MMAKVDARQAKVYELTGNFENLEKRIAENGFVYDEESRDKWLEYYDEKKKAERALKKAFAEFRKAIEGDDEISHIANRYNYCDGKSDKAFYERTRWALLEEYRHIEFIY